MLDFLMIYIIMWLFLDATRWHFLWEKIPIQSGLHAWFSEPFEYVSAELSAMDLEKEVEDFEALAELERAEEGSGDNDAVEEEDDVSKQVFLTWKRQLNPNSNIFFLLPVLPFINQECWRCRP